MNIKVGRYRLMSDTYSLWVEEEYTSKDSKGKEKLYNKRVAGYARTLQNLYRQFAQHKYRSTDAESVRELLKVLAQTADDLEQVKTEAVKADLKMVRKIAKERGIK